MLTRILPNLIKWGQNLTGTTRCCGFSQLQLKRGLVLCSDVSTIFMILWCVPPWQGAQNVQLHPSTYPPAPPSNCLQLLPLPTALLLFPHSWESWTPCKTRQWLLHVLPVDTQGWFLTSTEPTLTIFNSAVHSIHDLGHNTLEHSFRPLRGTEQCHQETLHDSTWGEGGVILETLLKRLNSLSHQKCRPKQFSFLAW